MGEGISLVTLMLLSGGASIILLIAASRVKGDGGR